MPRGAKTPIKVDILIDDQKFIPTYESEGAVCADLVACIPPQIIDGVNMGQSIRLNYRGSAMIDCGISVAIPQGYKLCVAVRSGWASRGLALMNGVGQIDVDYRGKVKCIVANVIGREVLVINNGDRIGQCWLEPVYKIEWNVVQSLPETARGEGGFGSTGSK